MKFSSDHYCLLIGGNIMSRFNPTEPGWFKKFVFYFYFVGWSCFSFGFHVYISIPNIELHLPFGFIRIGWMWTPGENVL